MLRLEWRSRRTALQIEIAGSRGRRNGAIRVHAYDGGGAPASGCGLRLQCRANPGRPGPRGEGLGGARGISRAGDHRIHLRRSFPASGSPAGRLAALDQILRKSRALFSGVAVIGMPLPVDDQLFNCAVVLHQGRALGAVPKSFIPNYKEFYEGRWFASAATARSRTVRLNGEDVPFGTDLLFQAADAGA